MEQRERSKKLIDTLRNQHGVGVEGIKGQAFGEKIHLSEKKEGKVPNIRKRDELKNFLIEKLEPICANSGFVIDERTPSTLASSINTNSFQ